MIIDAENELATAQAITADAISENVIDLVATGYNASPNLKVVVRTGTAFDNASSITFEVYSHSTTTVTSGTLHASRDVDVVTAGANSIVAAIDIPQGELAQYLGVNCNVQGTNPTAGTVDIFLVNDVDNVFSKRLP